MPTGQERADTLRTPNYKKKKKKTKKKNQRTSYQLIYIHQSESQAVIAWREYLLFAQPLNAMCRKRVGAKH